MLHFLGAINYKKLGGDCDQCGGGNYCSNISPCRVIDVADVMPFPDTVKKRACCVCMVPPVGVRQEKRTGGKVCLSS